MLELVARVAEVLLERWGPVPNASPGEFFPCRAVSDFLESLVNVAEQFLVFFRDVVFVRREWPAVDGLEEVVPYSDLVVEDLHVRLGPATLCRDPLVHEFRLLGSRAPGLSSLFPSVQPVL